MFCVCVCACVRLCGWIQTSQTVIFSGCEFYWEQTWGICSRRPPTSGAVQLIRLKISQALTWAASQRLGSLRGPDVRLTQVWVPSVRIGSGFRRQRGSRVKVLPFEKQHVKETLCYSWLLMRGHSLLWHSYDTLFICLFVNSIIFLSVKHVIISHTRSDLYFFKNGLNFRLAICNRFPTS